MMSQALTIVFNVADAELIIILTDYFNMIKFVFCNNEKYEIMSEYL